MGNFMPRLNGGGTAWEDQPWEGNTGALTAAQANAVAPVFIGTFANLLSGYPAASYSGRVAQITNFGGMFLRSDGKFWKPVTGRQLLARSMVPMAIPPGFSALAVGGAFTLLGSGLPFASITGCWLGIAANAAGSGLPAGWYYAVMSSATQGTLYQNTFDPTTSTDNSVPASPTACTSAAAQAGVTGELVAMQLPIPGNLLGKTGGLVFTLNCNQLGTTDHKLCKAKYGATTVATSDQTSNQGFRTVVGIGGIGFTNRQVARSNNSDGGGSSSVVATYGVTNDTTTDLNAQVTLQVAATTNNQSIVLSEADIELVH